MDSIVPVTDPHALIGTWRSFGEKAPLYEIVGVSGARADGRFMMRIKTLDSGEEIDYALEELLEDPVAR